MQIGDDVTDYRNRLLLSGEGVISFPFSSIAFLISNAVVIEATLIKMMAWAKNFPGHDLL